MYKNYKDIFFALLILGMAFMGIAFVFVKGAVTGYSPFVFLFYRFLLATFVLSVIFYKHIPKISGTTIRTASVCGIPLFLSILFQTIGLKYTTVSNSAFITGMVVLLIPIFKMVFYKKPVRLIVWISCNVAMVGLYIITFKKRFKLKHWRCVDSSLCNSVGFLRTSDGQVCQCPPTLWQG